MTPGWWDKPAIAIRNLHGLAICRTVGSIDRSVARHRESADSLLEPSLTISSSLYPGYAGASDPYRTSRDNMLSQGAGPAHSERRSTVAQPTRGLLLRPFRPPNLVWQRPRNGRSPARGIALQVSAVPVFCIAIYGLSYKSPGGLYRCPQVRHEFGLGMIFAAAGRRSGRNPSDEISSIEG